MPLTATAKYDVEVGAFFRFFVGVVGCGFEWRVLYIGVRGEQRPHPLLGRPTELHAPIERDSEPTTSKPHQVGRIRQSLVFGKKGLDLFVCGDQVTYLNSRLPSRLYLSYLCPRCVSPSGIRAWPHTVLSSLSPRRAALLRFAYICIPNQTGRPFPMQHTHTHSSCAARPPTPCSSPRPCSSRRSESECINQQSVNRCWLVAAWTCVYIHSQPRTTQPPSTHTNHHRHTNTPSLQLL